MSGHRKTTFDKGKGHRKGHYRKNPAVLVQSHAVARFKKRFADHLHQLSPGLYKIRGDKRVIDNQRLKSALGKIAMGRHRQLVVPSRFESDARTGTIDNVRRLIAERDYRTFIFQIHFCGITIYLVVNEPHKKVLTVLTDDIVTKKWPRFATFSKHHTAQIFDQSE